MVFLDHYFLFLARKYNAEDSQPCGEFLYLTKNMVVHNAANPFMIHHEAFYIEKVVNANHKLLFTMGKDRQLSETGQVEEEAYFIKIWDFVSLVEGTSPGCKCATNLSAISEMESIIDLNLIGFVFIRCLQTSSTLSQASTAALSGTEVARTSSSLPMTRRPSSPPSASASSKRTAATTKMR